MQAYQYLAGGEWLDTDEHLESDDPYLGAPWALIPRCGAAEVDRAVRAAHLAFTEGPWSRLTATGRGRLLRRMGEVLAANAERLAAVETRDNGKRTGDILPGLTGGLRDSFDYYAGLADKVEGTVPPTGRPTILNYTTPVPYGVIAAITAWNSPLLIAIQKLAPALAAGNTVVLKPSEHASASTLELAEVLADADLPAGVINVVTGLGAECGQPLVEHPLVRKVSFTGSAEGGRAVAMAAAANLTPCTMELGGKSPQIVFDDIDLDAAVFGVAGGIFPPSGQSCIAGSRALVHESIHDAFVERLVEVVGEARPGAPTDPGAHYAPIANRPHYDRILGHIAAAVADGARCVAGGGPAAHPDGGDGWFVEPTVFIDVTQDMAIAREEVFGPVLAVLRFTDEDEAVALANDSLYGLAAGIWSADLARGIRLAERIEAGTVYVNNYFDACPQSPVGGFKASGYGRENGIAGFEEFVQTRSVWVDVGSRPEHPFPPA
jgi:aldehyde dehydrogenase (NAD+)